MTEIRLVVFDMAGTTVYDGDAVHRCLQDALDSIGATVTRDEVNAVMGIAKPVAIRLLMETHEIEPEKRLVDSVHAEFMDRMVAYYRSNAAVREIEGTTAVFRQLNDAGISIALDTGFSRTITNAILERMPWHDEGLLSATVCSDEVRLGRPHPDMILKAMALTGVMDARQVAKVGDTPSDLHEGSKAGCRLVIGVTEGSHTRQQLEEHPHTHLVPNVTHVPGLILEASAALSGR